jgi:hypothetical protein
MSPISIPVPFPVGQKVICIRDDISAAALLDFKQLPVLNQVYTIVTVGWGKSLVHGELGLGIRLAEIELREHARDAWFCLSQFRLLDDEEELQQLRQPLALSA